MIAATTFAGQRIAVFGLGASGIASAQSLLAGGAEVAAWDDGAAGRAAAEKTGLPVVDLTKADWSTFQALVLAPGVPLTHPKPHWTVERARMAGIAVIGDIEIFFRERAAHCPAAPVIAITGTNGKSTTTALITHLLRATGRDAQMGGNIGRAILTLDPPALDRIHVVEMSSFQIDLTPSLKPTVGVLLNISPDHLDRHGPADDAALAMRNYASIKARLVEAAEIAVIGIGHGSKDEPDLCEAIASSEGKRGRPARLFTTGRSEPPEALFERDSDGTPLPLAAIVASGSTLVWRTFWPIGVNIVKDLTDLQSAKALRGAHNTENAAAAYLVCEALGLEQSAIVDGLATYPGLPHRMEEVGRAGRVVFINDSKATNADSTEKALASWPSDIFWILGGKAKEGGITTLTPFFPRIAKAYLIGEASEAFAATLEGHVSFERCGTLDVATRRAAEDAARSPSGGPVVLLSPACASYDQFKGFDQRGDVFRDFVRQLPGVTSGGARA